MNVMCMKIQTSSLNQSEETLDKHTVQVIFNQHIMLILIPCFPIIVHKCGTIKLSDYQTVGHYYAPKI